ncbi:MAG: hypothetical protein Q8L56_07340 [Rhodocyclaceae bacterium]|nr:hypothetical protein [Rhodocyclaceae bacterium]
MQLRSHSISDDIPRRRVGGFEGGSVYEAEENGKFLVIVDEGTLLDFLNEEDRAGLEPISVYEFETAADRRNFFIQKKWPHKIIAEQRTFLDAQIFSLTLMATVQRNKYLYRKDASEGDKKQFREKLRKKLRHIAERYELETPESDEHIANIVGLADHISANCSSALMNGRFKIGAAQKALNLYLKYLWCFGRIPTPPHCPFDFVVLSRIPGCQNVRWTQLDHLPEYESIVQHAERVAGKVSLAEWELSLYNDAQPGVPADLRQNAGEGR